MRRRPVYPNACPIAEADLRLLYDGRSAVVGSLLDPARSLAGVTRAGTARVLLVEDDEGDAFLVRELLAEVGASRGQPNGLLLVAIALAHELEEERDRRSSLEARVRGLLGGVLHRIDRALDGDHATGD